MDKQILQMLGLFTVPPEIKVKGKEEKQLESQLLREGKDFFDR